MAGLLTRSTFKAFPSHLRRDSGMKISKAFRGTHSSGNCCRFSRHSLLSKRLTIFLHQLLLQK